MHIDIISAVPQIIEDVLAHSIIKRAVEKSVVDIRVVNLRDFGLNNYNQIDDYQYGGGAGMVLMVEPLYNCISKLQEEYTYDEIIYLCPDGKKYDQKQANSLSLLENVLIIAGHYKGIDERIREHFVTMELSIGDYVLSGGELPACVLVDSIVRILPGAISDETSALQDSFQDGLLAPPAYSRPADFMGWKVPEILLSGHEERIQEWRHEQSLKRTKKKRPDLLD